MELLDDINVIEIGSTIVGPYASQALGALGADVIKIEPPSGDPFRGELARESDIRTYFAMCNAEKRSLKLDLKQDAGREALLDLASEADVIIENFRPGVVDRLGVGYDDVTDVSEDIIYCSISGFGEDSQANDRAIFDPMLQGLTGLMSTTGEKGGDPVRLGIALIDIVTGIWSTVAIQSAIRKRDQTGEGSFIDMRMYDVGVSLLTKKAAHFFEMGENPPRMGLESNSSHPYGGYPTADGKMIMVGAPQPAHWPRFCKAIGREDLIDDARFRSNEDRVEHRDELNEILRGEFERKPRDEWEEVFLNRGLPVGPIHTIQEALENEFTTENKITTTLDHQEYGTVDTLNLPIKIDGERQKFESAPPQVGEHSYEILKEVGLSEDDIEKLAEEDVI